MKEEHLNKLSLFKDNDAELENSLLELLTNEKDALNFEELLRYLTNAQPVFIKNEIIIKIGKKYYHGDTIGSNTLSKDNIKAYKLFQIAASNGSSQAEIVCGILIDNGSVIEDDFDRTLNYLLAYKKSSNKIDLNIKIARIYCEKGQYQKALEFYLEYYNTDSDKKTKNDSILKEIWQCYFNLDNLSPIIEWKDINWDIMWVFIQENKEVITNNAKYSKLINLLLKFSDKNKNEAIEIALKCALAALYPLADDAPAAPDGLERLVIDERPREQNQLAGWDFKINNTLCDGYDKELFSKEVADFEVKIKQSVMDINSLELKLSEAQEEGYSPQDIEKVENEIKTAKANYNNLRAQLEEILYAARRKEMQRQYDVQRRFFDPRRTHKSQTKEIAQSLQKVRLTADYNVPLQLNGNTPTRRIITAERSTIEASKNTFNLEKGSYPRNQLYWIDGKNEFIKLQELTIKYDQRPGKYNNHLGNYFMTIPDLGNGDYNLILPFLQKLTQSTAKLAHQANEINLANLMLDYAKTGKPTTFAQLQVLNPQITEQNLNTFNTICYHVFVKEIARRMPSEEDIYDFPAAIITSRAIRLIAAGYLTLQDVFSDDASYGVVTGTLLYNNHDKVKLKINRVNRLYNELIYKPNYHQQLADYFEQHTKANIIASRQQLRKELHDTYGGDSDTDGQGYSSSEDNSPRKLI